VAPKPTQGRLAQLDLGLSLTRAEEKERLAAAQRRLLALRLELAGKLEDGRLGPPICVLFEGWDASGKGGAIKRLVARLDPRHVRVASFAAPTPREKRHHFLWRFWKELPGLGEMAVFDRSWYGRVLVERVEGFASDDEWKRGFEAIVDFERSLVTEGVILAKFWMHITDEEQLRRFQARAADPLKRWKLTDEDWRNRAKNRHYDEAAEEMFIRTEHPLAPWDVIAAEQKRFARIAVIETLIVRIEEGIRRWGMRVPHIDELDILPA
jgi:polyphosphate kinase 2 (PPK2 family)